MLYHSDIVKQKRSGVLYALLRENFLSRANIIVATSPNYVKSSTVLRKHLEKIRIIPLTSIPYNELPDISIIEKYKLEHRKFVLFVGVLRYYKGLDTLVRAAKNISCTVVIAGEGPERYRLEELSKQLGINNIVFTGMITNAQKKSLFQRASVFAFPSQVRSEAFGISLAEAAMYGVPMVSCEIGTGTSYINVDGVTGFVIKPNDVKEFSQAVNTILNNYELAEKMSNAAVSRWKEKMSPEIFGKNWADLFLNILNSKVLC